MANPITWDMVVDFAAELSTVDADAQAAIIAWINEALEVDLFDGEDGPMTKLARIYLAAHFGAMSKPSTGVGAGTTTGPMVSSSAGGLTRSFANTLASGGSGTFSQTRYGVQYEGLLKMTTASFGFVT